VTNGRLSGTPKGMSFLWSPVFALFTLLALPAFAADCDEFLSRPPVTGDTVFGNILAATHSQVRLIRQINIAVQLLEKNRIDLSKGRIKFLLGKIRSSMNGMDPVALEMVLRFADQGDGMPPNFYDTWEKCALRQFSLFPLSDLSYCLFLINRMRERPSQNFLGLIEKRLMTESLSVRHKTQFARGFAAARYRLPWAFLRRWQDEFIKIMPASDSQLLTIALHAVALVGFTPSNRFLSAWTTNVIDHLDSGQNWGLHGAIFDFCLLDRLEPLQRLLQHVRPDDLETESYFAQAQLAMTYLYFERMHRVELPLLRPYARVIRELVTDHYWQAHLRTEMSIRLERLGEDYIENFETESGLHANFYLPRLNRILNVNSYERYLRDRDGKFYLLPQDERADQILRTYGYEVRRIKLDEDF
jgi:hypothetical protein